MMKLHNSRKVALRFEKAGGNQQKAKEGFGMQYGYFDDKEREYVITRPDTPAPWVNYLGSPEYLSLIHI